MTRYVCIGLVLYTLPSFLIFRWVGLSEPYLALAIVFLVSSLMYWLLHLLQQVRLCRVTCKRYRDHYVWRDHNDLKLYCVKVDSRWTQYGTAKQEFSDTYKDVPAADMVVLKAVVDHRLAKWSLAYVSMRMEDGEIYKLAVLRVRYLGLDDKPTEVVWHKGDIYSINRQYDELEKAHSVLTVMRVRRKWLVRGITTIIRL